MCSFPSFLSALCLRSEECFSWLLLLIYRRRNLREKMKNFFNEKVGAVAGNVKVGNEFSVMAKWQSIEYITSQNFDRRAFDYFNCITVIPGAIGGFRKSAMIAAGKFAVDTLAEDCDTTI